MGWLDAAAGVTAGLVGGGGVATALLQGAGAQQANSANHQNWNEQALWEMQMSNTAHQREVKDLQAAGLNPLLSVNSGASTPASPQMQPSQSDKQAVAAGLANSASSFMDVYGKMKNAELTDAQTKQVKAQTGKTGVETENIQLDKTEKELKSRILNHGIEFMRWLDGQKGHSAKKVHPRGNVYPGGDGADEGTMWLP